MSELKVALKSKAIEHKRREAKALVLTVNEDEEEMDSNEEKSDESDNESKGKRRQDSDQRYSAINYFNENQLISGQKVFGFESQLASIVAQKASMFAVNDQTESFGDQSDEEINEEFNG